MLDQQPQPLQQATTNLQESTNQDVHHTKQYPNLQQGK
jgi:hypothetical protein